MTFELKPRTEAGQRFVDAARQLTPLLRENADAADRTSHMPTESFAAVREAALREAALREAAATRFEAITREKEALLVAALREKEAARLRLCERRRRLG